MSDAPRDYSETLFLPKTDFPMRAGLPQKEPEILARWQKLDTLRFNQRVFSFCHELRNQPLIVFVEPSILAYRFSKYAIDHLNCNPIGFFKADRVFLCHFRIGCRDW